MPEVLIRPYYEYIMNITRDNWIAFLFLNVSPLEASQLLKTYVRSFYSIPLFLYIYICTQWKTNKYQAENSLLSYCKKSLPPHLERWRRFKIKMGPSVTIYSTGNLMYRMERMHTQLINMQIGNQRPEAKISIRNTLSWVLSLLRLRTANGEFHLPIFNYTEFIYLFLNECYVLRIKFYLFLTTCEFFKFPLRTSLNMNGMFLLEYL